MPFFEYSATDATGKRVAGAVQSADSNAAREALVQAGLRTVDVWRQGESAAPAIVAPLPVAPRPSVGSLSAPMPVPVVRTSAPLAAPPQATPDVVKTRQGSEKELYFLLTQLSGLQTAGIAPSSFLEHLADRASPTYKDSLLDASARVGQGSSMSEVMARYPNLYPAYVVGLMRAGEKSGEVAEATTLAADSVNRSYRLRKRLSYFPIVGALMVLIYPLSMGVINGSLDSIKAQDKAGGSLPVFGTLLSGVGQNMRTWGLIAVAVVAGLLLVIFLWSAPVFKRLRHRLGLFLFGARARAEAVTRVSWAISRTSKAGIPHYEAFRLAAECVPNDILRESLVAEAAKAREGEPLSVALRRSLLLSDQYADVVHTGEITGDVPKAMDQLAQFASSDFEGADTGAVGKGMAIFYVILAVLTLVLVVSLAVAWYGGLIQWGLSDEAMGA